jgi:hypothetical protein
MFAVSDLLCVRLVYTTGGQILQIFRSHPKALDARKVT